MAVACRFRETNFGTATGKKNTKKQPRTRIQEQKTILKLERLNSQKNLSIKKCTIRKIESIVD